MNQSKLIYNLVNALNGVVLILFMFKQLHFFTFLRPIKLFHFIFAIAAVYALTSYIEVKYKIQPPKKSNSIIKLVYNLGGGVFILGFLFGIMHWPFSSLLYLIGCALVLISYILPFVLTDHSNNGNSDVIDDMTI